MPNVSGHKTIPKFRNISFDTDQKTVTFSSCRWGDRDDFTVPFDDIFSASCHKYEDEYLIDITINDFEHPVVTVCDLGEIEQDIQFARLSIVMKRRTWKAQI